MIDVDGEAGGGQLLRTALTYAMLTETSVRVENVRGNRPDPGLKPQHRAAVRVAAAVSDADVDGEELGSETVEFDPRGLSGGHYEVDVGTAGSTTLLFDTLLPVATALDAPLSLTARGGTDVKWAPTMPYYRRVKLPLLRRFGLQAAVDAERPGFYPVGGGKATLRLAPSTLDPIRLAERGDEQGIRVYSTAADSLANADVADRQATRAVERLDAMGHEVLERSVTYAAADCPGSVLCLRADYDSTTTGFDALGEKGMPSEDVADEAVDAFVAFAGGDAAVDTHMADQLLVFLALAGGELRVPSLTDHVETSLELLAQFGFELTVSDDDSPTIASGI
ncbi:RNA 3'-terminal phosphate cyclase [Haloarculaceae archaeon H-GB2-1]|nr:RNA 3'-terminal phosphate cyclase [Haloarculaceae archaeon H-GB1-1]MEA5387417.1 RNA 3'-terminal phosphate cyclase [Haloarculaceae archaeon H-GB11]MEA5408891.1 RNA 3'-terminal phosphate cyclase [Haloarculaceae archaeon H-GB2-1]